MNKIGKDKKNSRGKTTAFSLARMHKAFSATKKNPLRRSIAFLQIGRMAEEAEVEKLLAKKGIPQEGIEWRRRNLPEIDMAIEKLHWWLENPKKHYFYTDYDYKDSMEHLVKCPICGAMDNDWPIRHGLCLDCWCREWNFRYSCNPIIHMEETLQ